MGAIFYSKVLVYRYVDFGGESHVLIIPFGCYQLMCKSLAETISGACSILGGWNYSYPCFPRHKVFFVCKISSCRHCPHYACGVVMILFWVRVYVMSRL